MRFSTRLLLLAALLAVLGPAVAATVNINQADAAALQENLAGVGPVKAKAIVDYRKKNGPFKSIDDLSKVPGIGAKMLVKMRKDASLSKGATQASKDFKPSPTKSAAKSKSGSTGKTSKPQSGKSTASSSKVDKPKQ